MNRIFVLILLILPFWGKAQELKDFQKPGIFNPMVPGYFADPTIKKIGDTYYMYATTDGNGWGAGPSQVWISKDFVNWSLKPMNWPNTHWYWAPDMTKGYDGKYYLYYSQPVEIFGASSENPTGPWTPLKPEGESVIPNYMIPGVITLDAQTFTDDDGSIYMFWGTWGIYPDHGCAVGLLNKDMTTFSKVELIPNTVAKDFFEAPFMFKRNGIYYMMYSSGRCEDHSYRVQYVKSTSGPFGPYEYPAHNPILVTNEDGSVHGPGHHSVLQEGEDYYIVYHRHNNPNSGGGFHRQLAADKLLFDEKGDIVNVVPTHEGIGFLAKNILPYTNLVREKKVTASSEYNQDFRASFAVDDNNGTLWRAKDNMTPAWIGIDLGSEKQIKTILTQFEYATWYYEYLIEYSTDGKNWKTFADKRKNRVWGSPLVDRGDAKMRYIKVHIFDTQIAGLPKGIWNIKAFEENVTGDFFTSEVQETAQVATPQGLLIDISAEKLTPGQTLKSIPNKGKLKGNFTAVENAYVDVIKGKKAISISDFNYFESDFEVPASLSGNSSFTVAFDVFNPSSERYEPVITWSQGRQDLGMAEFGAGNDPVRGAVTHGAWPNMPFKENPKDGVWNKVVITFDGYLQKIFVNDKLVNEGNKMLFLQKGTKFYLGTDAFKEYFFDGKIASLQVYDRALNTQEIKASSIAEGTVPYYFTASDLEYNSEKQWENRGSESLRLSAHKMQDVAGKQSVISAPQLIPQSVISEFKKSQNLFLSYQVLVQKTSPEWQIVTIAPNADFWINGKKQKGKSDFKIENAAVSKWMIASNTAEEVYTAWANNTDFSFLQSLTPKIYKSSGTNVLATLGTVNKKGIRYLFSNGTNQSGWTDKTHYFFQNADYAKGITVKAKDEHGNVSGGISVVIDKSSTKETKPELTNSVDFLSQTKYDFWDGFVIHTNSDSLQAKIAQKDGEITLESIHSSWSGQGKKGPFLYKNITGDFTFSAEISDLVGKKEKRNTSTEVGIMVRSADSSREIHIQNTILTGWNLGNMTTYTNGGRRVQKNNGTAWNFMKYLQIQKAGEYFYLRASDDNKTWVELPGSPVHSQELSGKKMTLGIFQSSNNNVKGFGSFKSILLTQ